MVRVGFWTTCQCLQIKNSFGPKEMAIQLMSLGGRRVHRSYVLSTKVTAGKSTLCQEQPAGKGPCFPHFRRTCLSSFQRHLPPPAGSSCHVKSRGPGISAPPELASLPLEKEAESLYAMFNKLSKPEMFLSPLQWCKTQLAQNFNKAPPRWFIATNLCDYLTFCMHNWIKQALSPLFFLLLPISPIIFIFWSQDPFNTSSLPGRAAPAC